MLMPPVAFLLKGAPYRLDSRQVVDRLKGAVPERIQSHAVEVDGTLYPVKQAFGLVTGLDRLDFITTQARAVFQRLGFRVMRVDRGQAFEGVLAEESTATTLSRGQKSNQPAAGGPMESNQYWVHVNHPTSKARLHVHGGCAHVQKAAARVSSGAPYGEKRGDANGLWVPFNSIDEAESYQEQSGKKTRDRCNLGPCRALLSERLQQSKAGVRSVAPRTFDFTLDLSRYFNRAKDQGLQYVDVNAGDIHRSVGGYPGKDHRMPRCCDVMRAAMRKGDEILAAPPRGDGSSLTIRYRLPR